MSLLLSSAPAALFLLVPLLALVLRIDLATIGQKLALPEVQHALALSLQTTLQTVALTIMLGTPLAYLLARRRFPGRMIIDTLVDLVIVLPPAVAGIALFIAFGRQGWLWQVLHLRGIAIPFTPLAVVLAQAFVAGPFYIRSAVGALTTVRRDLEEAALLDGASAWQVFWYITVPLAAPGLLSGVVMTWARALGEFGATILFAGNLEGRTQTVPLLIYLGFERDLQEAVTLAVVLLCLAFAVLFVVKMLLHRQIVTSLDVA